MARVSEVKVGLGAKNRGDFRVKKFNLFNPDDMDEYAKLRTKANNASSGIAIEQIREYSRKTTIRDHDGDDSSVTTVEDVYLVVQYWEKKPRGKKGSADDELAEKRKIAQLPGGG